MDNAASQYQTLPEFTTYLWYLTQWSEFNTPFHIACDFADNITEQDELRPIFHQMVEQYQAAKQIGALLASSSFWAWYELNEAVRKVRAKYSMAT